jgi:hypothetical protein
MTYAIQTLEKERQLLEQALHGWQSNNQSRYKAAYEQRQQRLYEIESAIEILKQVK